MRRTAGASDTDNGACRSPQDVRPAGTGLRHPDAWTTLPRVAGHDMSYTSRQSDSSASLNRDVRDGGLGPIENERTSALCTREREREKEYVDGYVTLYMVHAFNALCLQ